MMKIKGRLISFNNFLSTSTVRKVSLGFAQNARRNPDRVGVLFIIKINPGQSTTPFASIAGISDFEEEEEILFSMHSVFRIQDFKQIAENNRLYEVNLDNFLHCWNKIVRSDTSQHILIDHLV
ncbi:unnamed protein product [Adineta steineri]|uniref:ADP ribosyltransferase domain-containing protein n=1 Tax=Adineta steineri TaxID=433720 RepID=A0A813XDW7_9BILA|nr:unnamed protein product [Adineta steineri]